MKKDTVQDHFEELTQKNNRPLDWLSRKDFKAVFYSILNPLDEVSFFQESFKK